MTGTAPGELLGAGRSADVYAFGEGRVLRRYRSRDVSQHEVLAMAAAARAGFSVPRVLSFRGPDLILTRIEGHTMQDELGRASLPRVGDLARQLAGLHIQLHKIRAPEGFATPFGEGTSLVHLDLHPGNVLLAPTGPVVIDWPNAARGPAAADVALSVVIFETAQLDPESEPARQRFVSAFLAEFDAAEVARYRAAAARFRLEHAALTPEERAATERLR